MEPVNREWTPLRLPPLSLAEARLQCHHAVQIETRLARGFVPARPDDSHTSLSWDPELGALMGQPFAADGREVRGGLRLRDLTLLFDGLTFPLDGRSFSEAIAWLGERLQERGLDPAPLSQPIHFELEDHPLLHGAKFDAAAHTRELEELAGYYANAASCIKDFVSPVRCWPHHFDIAGLIAKGERSTGIGMSPGDGSYAEPYFYVSPFPYPGPDQLPRLHSRGHWHTEGWTGAVLTASEFAGEDRQQTIVRDFLEEAAFEHRPSLA